MTKVLVIHGHPSEEGATARFGGLRQAAPDRVSALEAKVRRLGERAA